MKKLIGFNVLAAIVAVGAYVTYCALSITDPYVVEASEIRLVPHEVEEGFRVDIEHRVLSVVSDKEIVLVADPGFSFHHEVLWLVEKPRKASSTESREFRFELPEYAKVDQIFFSDASTPLHVLKTASGSWN
ncbi:MAG TPA: hypothetical protein VIT21_12825 [Chthoniobacterales bacterium]